MKRFLILLLFCLVGGFGCGSNGSEDVFLATGDNSGTLPATTGRVVFNFTRPQSLSVPVATTELEFHFLNQGVLILSERRTYSDQVVFENVPTTATTVEVTAINSDGFPILFATGTVEPKPDQEFVVTLTSVAVTLDEVVVAPIAIEFAIPGETQQLSLIGRFSNGFLSNLDPSQATYSGFDPIVATVNNEGLVTSGSFGMTSIIASFEVSGVTTDSSAVPVNRAPVSLALTEVANTFDTTTGQLNGAIVDGWDGAILNVADFTLPTGSTLTVTGDQALQLAATGNIVLDGIVEAAGENGETIATNDLPAGLGGLAGPGGFPGGRGGGFDVADSNGESGFGPGGGGGGSVDPAMSDGFAGGSGGGAGHLVDGTAGTGFNFGIGGAAGSFYTSVPTTLVGGSGGGGGSIESDTPDGLESGDDGGAGGGGGGGLVRMTALGTLEVSGTINCSGGNGGNAGPNANGTAGGGGSGGAIELLASAAPVVTGTLNVSGGLGGVDLGESLGGDGSDGRTNVGTL